jgi:S1-C subfamily serine protease
MGAVESRETPAGAPAEPWPARSPEPDWGLPTWGAPPGGTPPWLPPDWGEPPPPPPATGKRTMAVVLAALVVIGGIGAGVGFGIERLTSSGSASDHGVVDINSQLNSGSVAAGTGMIVNAAGQVLTNNHVVENANSITVQRTDDGTEYSASVVGVDPSGDIALLQLQNASGLPTISVGDSAQLKVGDRVTAVGNALGRGGSPVSTQGSITGLGQTITASDPGGANAETLNNMIQFDAQIQPGDSGGPLLNGAGQVIGMDTAGAGRVRLHQGGSNVGFAIPINDVMAIIHDIQTGTPNPNVQQGGGAFLGVRVNDSTSPPGALVVGVDPDSPAQAVGIGPQDVIVMVGSDKVDSVNSLRAAIARHKPSDKVMVTWLDAAGQSHSAEVVLAAGAIR